MSESPLNKDAQYVVSVLFPEIEKDFRQYSKEYQQERDLGVKGEFVGLYRKVRKLKTALWDGNGDAGWREPIRKIFMEVACHALLAVKDLDNKGAPPAKYESLLTREIPQPTARMLGKIVYDAQNKYFLICTGIEWIECSDPEQGS